MSSATQGQALEPGAARQSDSGARSLTPSHHQSDPRSTSNLAQTSPLLGACCQVRSLGVHGNQV